LALRELAEMDAVGGHQLTGVKSSTASWLRDSRHLTDGAARATVGLAVALRDDLPFIGELLLTGAVSVEHAAAVRDGVRGLDAEVVTEAADGWSRWPAAPTRSMCASGCGTRRTPSTTGSPPPPNAAPGSGWVCGCPTSAATPPSTARWPARTARPSGWRWTWPWKPTGKPVTQRGKAARQADVLVGWASDYLHRTHGPGDSLADDAHTVRTHLHILCRPDQLNRPDTTTPLTLAELIHADLHGAPPAAAGIAGDLGGLSRQALRRLACDATLDLVSLHPGTLSPIDVGRAIRTVTAGSSGPWSCATGTAWSKAATAAPPSAPPTTSGTGPTAAAATWTTSSCSATSTTTTTTTGNTTSPPDGQRWLTQTGWRHAPP
jgi:hypothetical protein